MALRFVLLGLVASMGFEMPSTQDLASWSRSGREWFDARLADVSCLRAEAARAFDVAANGERVAEAPAPEVAPTRDDLTFDAVVDGMAKDFSTDLAALEAEKTLEFEEALTVVEPFREMPPAVVGIGQPEPEPSMDPAVGEVAVAAPAAVPAQAVETESRVAKISAALRLTRQAMSAWAALIQPSPSATPEEDPGVMESPDEEL